jgi:beta-glucosidase
MNTFPYQDASCPTAERVKDLMGRMTLNQKIKQLSGIMAIGNVGAEQIKDGIGEVAFMSVAPSAKEMADTITAMQKQIMAQTPLGIPAIFHAEALSGLVAVGCAVFPTSISLGATFSPDLVSDMACRIRAQMLNLGIRQALSPVLDLARDFRWGRTNEDYGSDPTLVSAMACAFISALQGKDLRDGIAATAKHFLGYSMPEGGLNMARVQTDYRDIRENFAKPFEAAIRTANLRSVMNAYSEYSGQQICANRDILTGLLRDDLGFDGVVVSDYMSIDNLVKNAKTAEDSTDGGIQSLKAGLDMELPNPYGYSANLREAVKEGRIEEAYVDRALERVLTLKFSLGLFDKPFRDFTEMDNSDHNRRSALISEKVITLTKNSGILPLTNTALSIAVIGPTGNSIRVFNGSYTFPASLEMSLGMANMVAPAQQGVEIDLEKMFSAYTVSPENQVQVDYSPIVEQVIRAASSGALTTFEAVKEIFPNTRYAPGCDIKDTAGQDFAPALELAAGADVVILTVGGKNGWGASCTNGEGLDNTDITLPGLQAELVKQVFAVNKKIVVVHTDNKPRVDPFIYENIPAIIEGWLPGPYGGNAIARVLAGKVNPGGKLPVDVPRNVGQTPVYYYQHNGSRGDAGMPGVAKDGYVDCSCTSQLPFGFGLSYTEFQYSGGTIMAKTIDGVPRITLSIAVKNTGTYDGDEVVQLYGIDEVASIIRPQKELIGFRRVSLNAGVTKRVTFTFRIDQLAFQNSDHVWVVEKGKFRFVIGKGSNDPVYEAEYVQGETLRIDYTKRGFFADTAEQPL